MFVMENQQGGHQTLPPGGDTPTAAARDLGDQTVHVESLEQSAHPCTAARSFLCVLGRLEQLTANVAIAKAVDGMLAPHDGGEQSDVLVGGGVEAPVGPTVLRASQW